MVISTISYDQHEILKNIIELYIPGKRFDVDITFGKGNFYKKGVPFPTYMFDINPSNSIVLRMDSRRLEMPSNCVNSIVFDPPFLANGYNKNCIIINAYGQYDSPEELLHYYYDTLEEVYRVLNPGGILVFKCQDFIVSGKQNWSHVDIKNMADLIGFKAIDLFILLAKNRIMRHKTQKHARKFHSYFWVFRKD